ncbi:Crp/Fnr family transcriptional regulator [Sphingobacterium sp. HMA12]|jgi:CRP-like cAMP-binding protein|uniref:Crp/Fnr family transcriptional regulator n=1 Tax=Sphingobacterium sp. HMA12 TaxID=2050894 RepID=UPI000CE9F1E5|nr:Crp/Fnr family transcriptional regulator [Sphingobacterium sp. HMA12]
MEQHLLAESIQNQIDLNAQEKELFFSFVKLKKVKKKQVLLLEGDVSRYALFVVSGCLRSYCVDENGNPYIQQFAPEGWWIGDMYSLITGKPGHLVVDAIFDSEIAMIAKADLNRLYQEIPQLNIYFRILAENALVYYQSRAMENLRLTAKERYERFCTRYPSLIACLPQKQVAAYIGVTPEFLSKMLNQ